MPGPGIEPAIRSIAEIEATPVQEARGTSKQVLLGPEQGAARFATRRFTIDPGGRIPCHRHSDMEHEQVVMSGEMVLSLDGEEHTVRAGDTILIPAGVAHWYENRGDVPVHFLCIVPLTDSDVVEWLEPTAG